jgi:hypothetical protein
VGRSIGKSTPLAVNDRPFKCDFATSPRGRICSKREPKHAKPLLGRMTQDFHQTAWHKQIESTGRVYTVSCSSPNVLEYAPLAVGVQIFSSSVKSKGLKGVASTKIHNNT